MARTRMIVLGGAGIMLVAACWLLAQHSLLGKPAENHEVDRAAINAVLKAQQTAGNRGDVDAFLGGDVQSPELTFSGSHGVSRGGDGVLGRCQKDYPDRADS